MVKKNFLILNSKDISIKINDYNISFSMFFNTKNIPEKYQKIILKLYIRNFIHQGNAQEILTGIPFNLTGWPITKENNNTIIHGADTNNLSLYISTQLEKKDVSEVRTFYEKLKHSGYLEEYIKIIGLLFKIKLNEKTSEKKLLKIK